MHEMVQVQVCGVEFKCAELSSSVLSLSSSVLSLSSNFPGGSSVEGGGSGGSRTLHLRQGFTVCCGAACFHLKWHEPCRLRYPHITRSVRRCALPNFPIL